MNIKLIALDMDGTTLTPDHKVTSITKETIRTAQEKGIHVAISTGRSNTELIPIFRQFPEIRYFICGNGSKIYDKTVQQNIYENPLPLTIAKEIVTLATAYHVMPEVYAGKEIYTPRNCYKAITDFSGGSTQIAELIKRSRTPLDDLLDFLDKWGKPVEKMNILCRTPEEVRKLTDEVTSDSVSVTNSLKNNVEVGGKNASKGTALAHLAEKLSLSAENVMAIGDANNDLSMLAYAHCSVAMGNARPEVIQAARYQTLSNTEDGVAAAIQRYALGR